VRNIMKRTNFLDKEPIFIIGYPKSGNTWLTRLIADTLDSPMVGGDNPIDQADKKQRYLGDFVIYKSHYSEQSKPDYIRKYSFILYIVRDFRDVLVSGFFFNHKGSSEDKYTIENTLNHRFHPSHRYYFKHEIRRMVNKWQGNELTLFKNNIKNTVLFLKHLVVRDKRPTTLSVGNWSNHVNYWIGFPNANIVRYEDLLTDTYTTLKTLFSKMGVSCPERRIVEAVERQSFKTRKKQFEKNCDYINMRFMRKGVAGDWKRFLDKDMIELIKKEHGETMNRLGYEI